MSLATLACGSPVLVSAASCSPEPVPHETFGAAFQRGCDQRAIGNYAEAIQSFEESAAGARSNGNIRWEARSRVFAGSTRVLVFQYSAALQKLEEAATFAARTGQNDIAAGADGNIATIYAQMGNFALAQQKLQLAVSYLKGSSRLDLIANAYLSLSYLQIRLGDTASGLRSSDLCLKAAGAANATEIEAKAWDFRGQALLKAHQTSSAATCLQKAAELYKTIGTHEVPPLALSHLAELKRQQNQLEAALDAIDKALAKPDRSFKSTAQYYPLTVRASILKELGRQQEALEAYRRAVKSATVWRGAALPGDTTNIETARELNDTYQSFAEFAADLSLQRHSDDLAREALEALAQNRAASLREQLAVQMGRNEALPPEYLAKLGELQSVQARITLSEDATSQSRLVELETEIGELETKIGLTTGKRTFSGEKNPARNSLRDIQSGLGRTEALLSFCLGERRSFLWAITGDAMHLYRLPAAGDIGAQVTRVRSALEQGQNSVVPARDLGQNLFSQLDTTFRQKPDWLIVGDGALLDRVPFTMLIADDKRIFKKHSVRLLVSELLLPNRTNSTAQTRFLGIADPLYNVADSRRRQPILRNAVITKGSTALGRLPASQREIRSAAAYSGMPETDLLIGPDATIERLGAALSHQPSIIHFAVHVVSPPDHPGQAALALSLGLDNVPELLTREKIASFRVPGSLIILSGCASAQGQTAPSAGLIGLSRAWLLAGASAVIVSNWPTPDDSGQFFTVFYSYLNNPASGIRSSSLAQRAAAALEKAQIEMNMHGAQDGLPGFWAAYSIVSKE